MERILAAFVLGSAVLISLPPAHAQWEQLGSEASALTATASSDNPIQLPPLPGGKSTVFGGEIRSIDPVSDELILKVYGERPMTIHFDARTVLYLDGKRIPLRSLGPEQHAAVETILDGTSVFAVSIHLLSQRPEGDYQGRVARYDAGSAELTIVSTASDQPFTLEVARDASFRREGQPAFASAGSGPWDLQKGSLVAVEFTPGRAGRGVANKITVLAVPGAAFAFIGNIASLNLASGSMVLVDPRDQMSYQISFDPVRTPGVQDLHLGERVSVKAAYDGMRYMADRITPD
jgi:hypothetical protein